MTTDLITCTKRYSDYPFAHRQPKHDGHCALVHGHNWAFEFEFACTERDSCGFVVDFGKLKFIKTWLDSNFDHTIVLANDDPSLRIFTERPHLFKITFVDDPSCEGLASMVFKHVNDIIRDQTHNRVHLTRVTVYEDSKDSATYYAGG